MVLRQPSLILQSYIKGTIDEVSRISLIRAFQNLKTIQHEVSRIVKELGDDYRGNLCVDPGNDTISHQLIDSWYAIEFSDRASLCRKQRRSTCHHDFHRTLWVEKASFCKFSLLSTPPGFWSTSYDLCFLHSSVGACCSLLVSDGVLRLLFLSTLVFWYHSPCIQAITSWRWVFT